jgi:TM2 domain-containing membrane protein YozV
VAVILSAIFPGLGQFYNRHWFKGIGFFIGSGMLTGVVTELISVDDLMAGDTSGAGKALGLLLVLLGLLVWSMVDDYRSAKTSSPKG